MDARIKKISEILSKTYPNPKPFLNFKTPFELLMASVLSAQCTDARVNMVTPALFAAANTPEGIIKLGKKRLEELIRSTGFYHAKTRGILGAAESILKNFGGKMPNTLENLQKLPGIGRKTASVILSQSFGIPAFPVDRHVFRVTNRLNLSDKPEKTPDKIDMALRKVFPEKDWIRLHYELVLLGRTLCRPKPKCKECPLLKYCPTGLSVSSRTCLPTEALA
jgi:endonuclease-3